MDKAIEDMNDDEIEVFAKEWAENLKAIKESAELILKGEKYGV